MKKELIGRVDYWRHNGETTTDIVSKSEYGGMYETNIHDFLKSFDGKKVKITIELVQPIRSEDLVTVTYKELFKRCDRKVLSDMDINIWYLNEGGDPTAIRDIPKSEALLFMSEEEFNGRCHSSVNA